ncbi:hypothetical protein DYB37_005652 [Aphanomyces astaci]|uniref:Sister chromatid cohesion protein DCC1 n=1 Tax=Aphanomyces astaci TaxID=112090 RepID=A0A397DQU7_APHAT|nr:hypothetical protein DYB30_002828 [Aphanomyces astaci]RHY91103.1 hypothetical protein DYB35_003134 [Aphanomyces astaci]RHY96180.1 hypothetical protein DYB26_004684 [Aphanomyces astaci]RHZ25389.1 hypothetical protein DYB37_005652 [Aphanomyces astaci]
MTNVVFGDDYDEDAYKLMELPAEVCDSLTSGDEVYIVGDATQRAVLCTPSQSFYLVKEDQSNLRMLVDSCQWEHATSEVDITIRGCSINHYELTEKPLNVSELKALLMEAPWTKDWCAKSVLSSPAKKKLRASTLYTLNDLMDKLQHSAYEVRQILRQLRAVCIDGFWRLVDPSYSQHVMHEILDTMVQQDWDLSTALSVDSLQVHLDAVTPVILAHTLGGFSQPSATDDAFTLSPTKVAAFQATALFEERNEWPVAAFMEQWGFRVPDGVPIDLSLLRGIAILRGDASSVVYFPQSRLSIDPKTRFHEMFAFQPKWTLAQLEPYLEYVCCPSQLVTGKLTQASLLLKYTRASRVLHSPDRLYSKR